MTLEEAIQQRWESDVALTTSVPLERVYTSFVPADTKRPYVVVERRKNKPLLRASSGLSADVVEIVFVAEMSSYGSATTIAAAIADRFDSADFDAGEGRVVAMRRGEEVWKSDSKGTVRRELHYDVTLCRS
ncbi:MAG: DUF3168 domain-containing protein [Planctomycetia bacterium]|nr:DUF3168 domain-containing protein [Planctomycetia bacterium]